MVLLPLQQIYFMKQLFLISALSLLAIILLFCKKKEKDAPEPSRPKKELLITPTWKYSFATIYDNLDANGMIDPCEKDDTQKFYADNTCIRNDEGTRCNPTTEKKGTWKLTDNDSKLIMDTVTFMVEELTASSLKISYYRKKVKFTIASIPQ
jgi:hypothetical protein